MNPTARIFINYAREDEDEIDKLYNFLHEKGFDPWMDRRHLIGGERWELAIKKAVRGTDIFLACLSKHSVGKKGVIVDEQLEALDVRRSLSDFENSFIPVRLEICEPPEYLKEYQYVDWFEQNGKERLVLAVNQALGGVSAPPEHRESAAPAIDIKFLWKGSSQTLLHLQGGKDFDLRNAQSIRRLIDLAAQRLPRDRSRMNVFFCLLGDHLIERYDYYLMSQLLEIARAGQWGQQRYVVLNSRIGFIGVSQHDHASLSQWFQSVFDAGATDVLEIRYESQSPEAYRLSKAMDRSIVRNQMLKEAAGGKWYCDIRESSWELAVFLHEYEASTKSFQGNLVIVVEEGPSVSQTRQVRLALRKYPATECLAAVREASPASSLYRYCRDKNLRMIEWRGPFELRYWLLRLNSLGPQNAISS